MSDAAFTLTYDGPALSDHTMDVAALAPALLAMSQYMKATSRVVNGDGLEVSVRVQAHQPGCFQILLHLDGTFIANVVDMMSGKPANAVGNLLTIGGGVIALVKLLSGRPIRSTKPTTRGLVVIELEDGVTFEVAEDVARVASDPGARAALEKVVADQLDNDGVDSVTFGFGPHPVTVTADEAGAFRAPITSSDQILETVARMVFSIASLSFQPGNKWRLSTGKGPPISVTMADTVFIDRVQRSEVAFAKGDFLICDVKTTSHESAGKLVTEYVIQRVIEHRRSTPQPPLL